MKHTLLVLSLCLMTIFSFGQSGQNVEQGPNAGLQVTYPTKGSWVVQFQHNISAQTATAGVETDGTYLYATVWSANKFYKYNATTGALVDSFSITGTGFPTSGTSYVRDLAFDGTYFYGSNGTATIFKMDFTLHTCVGTITCPSGTLVRHIAYDPEADNNNGGFWVGTWSDGVKLVSRTGTLLNSIPAANLGTYSAYGSAYDVTGKFLWLYSQTTNGNDLIQVNTVTKQLTGITHDVTQEITVPTGSIAGGCFLSTNLISGTKTLGGLVQGQKIWGVNLESTVPDSFDISVSEITMNKYNPNNANIAVTGKVNNGGLITTTSYTLNYKVDNNAPVTQNVTGASIAFNASATFSMTTTIAPVIGTHTIKVWTSNPNGVADQSPANDTLSYTYIVYDVANAVQRKPFLEVFTSSSCAPCVAGNANLKTVLGANDNTWTILKYQMSWPGNGDPYYTAEGGTRRTFYGVNAVPDMYIDGQSNYFPTNLVIGDFNSHKTTPAFVALTATYSIGAPVVEVNVTIDPKIAISGNLKLFMGVIENKTTKNTATNGETEFLYVMKKMLPDANGITISALSPGTTVSKFQHYEFKGNYRLPANALSPINHTIENSVEEFSDLSVVVWLQDMTTKEIYQSNWATLVAGVDEASNGNGIIGMFPNPATNDVNVRFNVMETQNCEINIMNSMGQVVKTINKGELNFGDYTETINLNGMAKGIYFVSVKIGDNVSSHKLVVE